MSKPPGNRLDEPLDLSVEPEHHVREFCEKIADALAECLAFRYSDTRLDAEQQMRYASRATYVLVATRYLTAAAEEHAGIAESLMKGN